MKEKVKKFPKTDEELKHTAITLSLACIINVAVPNATHGRITLLSIRRFSFFILICAFLPVKNNRHHTHETACEIIVANAAPLIPILNPNINKMVAFRLIKEHNLKENHLCGGKR